MGKLGNELGGISVILNSTIKDMNEWEFRGSMRWSGGTEERKGGTYTGIKDSIKLMRRMLLQISNDMEDIENDESD